MEAIVERSAGLDVHQGSVVACVLIGQERRRPCKELRTFSTVTNDLEALRDWLASLDITHVGMESTGVYWKPVYAILEGHFTLIVGTAHHIKVVPGRKTDVKDAEWIADLVRHGLIKPSFVPPPAIRELRDLARLRRSLSEALITERNRTLKLLETANIKLASVVAVRRLWSGDARGARREHCQSGSDGQSGKGTAASQASAPGPRACGSADRSPSLHSRVPSPSIGRDRGGYQRSGCANRG
ncbi:MAG: IS110 family transposase [Acetobacteraceae bacterium]|nr:IS110 family transposase [Acetobacteraceae bacterium]